MKKNQEFILRVLCGDTKGIVAHITGLILKFGGNILDLEQHTDEHSGLFAMRIHIESLNQVRDFEKALKKPQKFKDFQSWVRPLSERERVAILVTKESYCLYDLLLAQKTGELHCEIPLIISNREDLSGVAKQFSIPFFCLPVEDQDSRKKASQEKKIEALLDEHDIGLTILARYMRILSKDFVAKREGKMINIHHSFLPAFKGAKPYHQAWERGVKIIGATAHYVTHDLDEGPIIHQASTPVSHQFSVNDLIRTGRELERTVLAQAVRAHLEHRVLLIGKRTIVFHF